MFELIEKGNAAAIAALDPDTVLLCAVGEIFQAKQVGQAVTFFALGYGDRVWTPEEVAEWGPLQVLYVPILDPDVSRETSGLIRDARLGLIVAAWEEAGRRDTAPELVGKHDWISVRRLETFANLLVGLEREQTAGQSERADRAEAQLEEIRPLLEAAYGESGDLVFITKAVLSKLEEADFEQRAPKVGAHWAETTLGQVLRESGHVHARPLEGGLLGDLCSCGSRWITA